MLIRATLILLCLSAAARAEDYLLLPNLLFNETQACERNWLADRATAVAAGQASQAKIDALTKELAAAKAVPAAIPQDAPK